MNFEEVLEELSIMRQTFPVKNSNKNSHGKKTCTYKVLHIMFQGGFNILTTFKLIQSRWCFYLFSIRKAISCFFILPFSSSLTQIRF